MYIFLGVRSDNYVIFYGLLVLYLLCLRVSCSLHARHSISCFLFEKHTLSFIFRMAHYRLDLSVNIKLLLRPIPQRN